MSYFGCCRFVDWVFLGFGGFLYFFFPWASTQKMEFMLLNQQILIPWTDFHEHFCKVSPQENHQNIWIFIYVYATYSYGKWMKTPKDVIHQSGLTQVYSKDKSACLPMFEHIFYQTTFHLPSFHFYPLQKTAQYSQKKSLRTSIQAVGNKSVCN